MTDLVILALIAGVPATLTSAAGVIVALKNGRKADDAAVKQEHIRELVNSNLSKVKDDLAEAKLEIQALRAIVIELRRVELKGPA